MAHKHAILLQITPSFADLTGGTPLPVFRRQPSMPPNPC